MIPALKCPPEIVPELVMVLFDFANDRGEVDRRMIAVLRPLSHASERTLLRAYAAPTLNNLGLAEGEGKAWRCSPDGQSLTAAYRTDSVRGLARFGYLLYQLDKNVGLNVIHELQSCGAHTEPVSRQKLCEILWLAHGADLHTIGMTQKVLADRLAKWLGYLQYARFVDYVNGDLLRLYPYEVQAIVSDEVIDWTTAAFTSAIFESYSSIHSERPATIYVPLPDLRQRLFELTFKKHGRAFSTSAFDNALRKLPKATDDYVILLSPPGSQSGGGITVGDNYYYYISIHKHTGEEPDNVPNPLT